MSIEDKLDPDVMVLTKQDVIDFLNAIKKRWLKNKLKNSLYIASIEGLIAMTYITPERSVNKFWKEVLRFFNFMLYKNAIAQSKQSGEAWGTILEKAKSYMEEEI